MSCHHFLYKVQLSTYNNHLSLCGRKLLNQFQKLQLSMSHQGEKEPLHRDIELPWRFYLYNQKKSQIWCSSLFLFILNSTDRFPSEPSRAHRVLIGDCEEVPFFIVKLLIILDH
ncbi:unnamed protein product [Moneuplotes crassus]|uniref:Uncharacterized protein n=1 Tax=Euplotes crassus TaxID=5936 RepID=A0AAD1UC25_EUPCR|nr:unnamed protein product [Moneuplotes crassus]